MLFLAHLDLHVDPHDGAVLAGLNDAPVVYLKVVSHDDVLQVRRRLENKPVLVEQAAAAVRWGGVGCGDGNGG